MDMYQDPEIDGRQARLTDTASTDLLGDIVGEAGGELRPAFPLPRDAARDGLDRYTRRDLRKEEIAIARRFHGGAMWPYPVAALAGFALWVSFFPLAMLHLVNLPLVCLISCALATGGYVTSHEAMHSNIAKKGEKLRWLNELTGAVSTIPIVFPFSMARLMHLEHHYHCNDPQKDPDYTDEASNVVMAIWKTWYNRQPGVDGSIHHYKRILTEMGTPEARRALNETIVLQLVFMAVLFAMAWSGYAIEAAAVWWLPRHVGLSYIRFYLSWAPHHPREGRKGRYENTYVFKSRLGHVLSMGMQYRIVHHLYPGIPNHRTKPAYYALRPDPPGARRRCEPAVNEPQAPERPALERPAEAAVRILFRWMPLIFGIGFIAPLIAQIMAARGWNAPFGLTRTELGLMIGAPWGLYAVVVGRWI